MDESVLDKLKILAESAKYDVSCASSGTSRGHKAGAILLVARDGLDGAALHHDRAVLAKP